MIFILLLLLVVFILLLNTKENFECIKSDKYICILGDFNHFKNSKLFSSQNNRIKFDKLKKSNIDKCSKILKWEPYNKYTIPDYVKSTNKHVINKELKNISKFNLDKVHKKIFKYGLEIDPLTYNKPFLEKVGGENDVGHVNTFNGHYKINYKSLNKKNPILIYQKLVNNKNENNDIIDYRLFIINRHIIHIIEYVVSDRFRTRGANSKKKQNKDLNVVFTVTEINKIYQIINDLNVDYGEIDVIRDYDTNRIYVIDINNTPWGTFKDIGISKEKSSLILNSL